jgi:D-alanine transaminase
MKKEPNTIYLNGNFIEYKNATIHINDKGFLFGDGIYEALLAKNKKLIDINLHYERMENSLKYMEIKNPFTFEEISNSIIKLLEINNINEYGDIYIQITRGSDGMRDHFINKAQKPNCIIIAKETHHKDLEKISCMTTADMRWQRRDIKTIQRLPNLLSRQQADDFGFDDAILIDNGIITESTSANLFIVDKNDNLITHPRTNKILSGITRKRVIEIAQRNNINVEEKTFEYTDLINAKEIFLTSSISCIRGVTMVDNKKIADGSIGYITNKIYQEYESHINYAK